MILDKYYEQFQKMNNSLNVFCEKIPSKSNSQYGIFYEDSIILKSILNLPIEIIDSPNIFSEESRKIKGLKIIVLHNNEKNKRYYTNIALEKGLFKVIPYMNAFFKVSLNNNVVRIKYYENNIIVKDIYNKNASIYQFDFKYKDWQKPENIPQFYIKFCYNISLYIFCFSCEVDGLFLTKDIFHTTDFKCYINFSKKKYSKDKIFAIPKDSIIIYETKSGDNLEELEEQIKNKCKFLENFFFVLPDYSKKDIIFIGLNTSKKYENYIYNFQNLIKSDINLIILDIHDQIFGEKIYYKNEQINILKMLKEDVQELKSDVQELKSDVQELKSDVHELKSDVQDIKKGINDLTAKLNFVIENLPHNHNTINTAGDENY